MKVIMIAAIGANNELGKDNKLIWSLPNDLKFFRKKTMNQIIVMGRKTFESLPKMLPNRKHVVLTKGEYEFPSEVTVCHSVEEVLNDFKDDDLYIIGGSSIYQQFLEYTDIMYLTEIDRTDDAADTFFPPFNKDEWETILIEDLSHHVIPYKHIKYTKRKKN
ncbi:MAG: dihydrofolate reductase [Bacilli bacterium]|nr:dihydrofolate reductase [Bacilli bacterium]MDD4808579.1 dihydrofolate reductase [Bacilli bacterium]